MPHGARAQRRDPLSRRPLTRLPRALQDHVFDPEVWSRSKPAAEFGPDIAFREYSVLENPRMPAVSRVACGVPFVCSRSVPDTPRLGAQDVLASRVFVNVCAGGAPCAPPAETDALVMNLTTSITDADAKAIFAPLSDIKILEFTSMLNLFGGWADDTDRERFYRRVKDYAGIWCCIHAHPVRRSCGSGRARRCRCALL